MRAAGTLLAAAAFTAPPAHADLNSRGRVCGAIAVTSPDQPRVRSSFSARKTLDLQLRMQLGMRDGNMHVVNFQVVTPKGHVYQEIQVVQGASTKKSVANISARLPVAGTQIATSSLYGQWRIVPYLDGGSRPCAAAAVFTVVR